MPSAPAAQSVFRYGDLPRADQLGARSPSTERMATSVASTGYGSMLCNQGGRRFMTPVTFQGDAPFSLPAAQGAAASARDGLVVASVADLLGRMLLEAAAEAAKQ
jgi:hypothetical protein